jgi:hypothetical protein
MKKQIKPIAIIEKMPITNQYMIVEQDGKYTKRIGGYFKYYDSYEKAVKSAKRRGYDVAE